MEILRMHDFSSQFLDNQSQIECSLQKKVGALLHMCTSTNLHCRDAALLEGEIK